MTINRNKMIKVLPLFSILIYLSFHLIEEGIFGFPTWAKIRWGIPIYDLELWLMHNYYFTFFLFLGYFIYLYNEKNNLIFGYGIIIWGLLNFLNHLIFTFIFIEYSPGLFTGIFFVILFIFSTRLLLKENIIRIKFITLSILCSLFYWILPIITFLFVDIVLLKKG